MDRESVEKVRRLYLDSYEAAEADTASLIPEARLWFWNGYRRALRDLVEDVNVFTEETTLPPDDSPAE